MDKSYVELLQAYSKQQQTIAKLKEVLELVNEHAETCAIFIWDGRACNCYLPKLENALKECFGKDHLDS